MDQPLAQPARVIAAHLAEWGSTPAYVELAVFGTHEPRAIAAEIDRFARSGARPDIPPVSRLAGSPGARLSGDDNPAVCEPIRFARGAFSALSDQSLIRIRGGWE